jgi:hypothetical protein
VEGFALTLVYVARSAGVLTVCLPDALTCLYSALRDERNTARAGARKPHETLVSILPEMSFQNENGLFKPKITEQVS